MTRKGPYLQTVLIVLLLCGLCAGADNGQMDISPRLKIYRNALLNDVSDEIRIDAASEMLFSSDPNSRLILLQTLHDSRNMAARFAICRAISRARMQRLDFGDKSDFVEPLMGILQNETGEIAKLAVEATLVFSYDQVKGSLNVIINNKKLPPEARLNAISALKAQPDKRAILRLLDILGYSDRVVSSSAGEALRSLGIPVSDNEEPADIRSISEELQQKSIDEFLRDRLIRQDAQMDRLEAELERWRRLYIEVLEELYAALPDVQRGAFFRKHLRSEDASVRLWALNKVEQWRIGTSPLPPELGPLLVELIADSDRQVRLGVAKLLSLMGELGSCDALLTQIGRETDEQVRLELFGALATACHYGLLSGTESGVSLEMRRRTLELAAEYLQRMDPEHAQRGAEAIRKLLERDGLSNEEVEEYMKLLAERFNGHSNSSVSLRGELVHSMAGLCAQSDYSQLAAKHFRETFAAALLDESPLVREAAVEGLIFIDKAQALRILRDFTQDESGNIRAKIIELAGEVGDDKDLVWLYERIGAGADSQRAWESMVEILRRSNAEVLGAWLGRVEFLPGEGKLSTEQKITLLQAAEVKIDGPKEVRGRILESLASLFEYTGDYGRAGGYLGLLRNDAEDEGVRVELTGRLLEAYVRGGNVEGAKGLIDNSLLEAADGQEIVIETMARLVADEAIDRQVLLALIDSVAAEGERGQQWRKQAAVWRAELEPAGAVQGGLETAESN